MKTLIYSAVGATLANANVLPHLRFKRDTYANLTTAYNLIRGFAGADQFCVQPGDKPANAKIDPGVQRLRFAPNEDCDTSDPTNHWFQTDDTINDGNGNCWTFHLTIDRAPLTLRPCDQKGWQNFNWDPYTGEIIPKRDVSKGAQDQQVIRGFANVFEGGPLRTITRRKIPTSQGALIPGSVNLPTTPGMIIANRDFLKGYCVRVKNGKNPAVNRVLKFEKCTTMDDSNTWQYSNSTRRISAPGYNLCAVTKKRVGYGVKLAKCTKKRIRGMTDKFDTNTNGQIYLLQADHLVVDLRKNRKLKSQRAIGLRPQFVSQFGARVGVVDPTCFVNQAHTYTVINSQKTGCQGHYDDAKILAGLAQNASAICTLIEAFGSFSDCCPPNNAADVNISYPDVETYCTFDGTALVDRSAEFEAWAFAVQNAESEQEIIDLIQERFGDEEALYDAEEVYDDDYEDEYYNYDDTYY